MMRKIFIAFFLSISSYPCLSQGIEEFIMLERLKEADPDFGKDFIALVEESTSYFLKKNHEKYNNLGICDSVKQKQQAYQDALVGLKNYLKVFDEAHVAIISNKLASAKLSVYVDSVLVTRGIERLPFVDKYFEYRVKKLKTKFQKN